jgi:hypothetical protein
MDYKSDNEELLKAKSKDNVYAIGYGDGGDTIYFTCPAKLINASAQSLQKLILTVDEMMWFEDSSRGIDFEEYLNPPEDTKDKLGKILQNDIWFNPNIRFGQDVISDLIRNSYPEIGYEQKLSTLREELKKNRVE